MDKCCNSGQTSLLKCNHNVCPACIEEMVQRRMKGLLQDVFCPIEDCNEVLSPNEIQENIDEELYKSYLDFCFQKFIEESTEVIIHDCPNEDCTYRMSVETRTLEEIENLNVNTITHRGEDGRLLSRPTWIHFNRYRIRCRECQEDFCTECKAIPYHLGMTCEQYKSYQGSRKCRFCQQSLQSENSAPSSSYEALQNCCNDKECLEEREYACEKTLPCSHFCGGIRGESKCLPCLHDDCLENARNEDKDMIITQKGDEWCPICYISDLNEKPSIRLNCGHIVHYSCAKTVLEKKWNNSNIHFKFRNCPLCNTKMEHDSLSELSKPIEELREQTLIIGRKVFDTENNLTDQSEISNPSSEYYDKKDEYILDKMTFYLCYKCDKPFYGGRVECGEDNNDIDPKKLLCIECNVKSRNRVNCVDREHQEFWVHKCRYCCSVANWFCFGNTHFCTSCHDKAGQLREKVTSDLQQCKGPHQCPLGVEHPPNGEEYVLSCQLCQEEVERDPELSKKIAAFERRQKIKRFLSKAGHIPLNACFILIFLSSFIYNIIDWKLLFLITNFIKIFFASTIVWGGLGIFILSLTVRKYSALKPIPRVILLMIIIAYFVLGFSIRNIMIIPLCTTYLLRIGLILYNFIHYLNRPHRIRFTWHVILSLALEFTCFIIGSFASYFEIFEDLSKIALILSPLYIVLIPTKRNAKWNLILVLFPRLYLLVTRYIPLSEVFLDIILIVRILLILAYYSYFWHKFISNSNRFISRLPFLLVITVFYITCEGFCFYNNLLWKDLLYWIPNLIKNATCILGLLQ